MIKDVAVSKCGAAEFVVKLTDIRQGQTKAFDVKEGCYDLRARFASRFIDTFDFGVQLEEDRKFTWTLGDQ